ncbi:MAG: glutamate--tRNA ligase [Candidatus Aminicenantales bacterium]
MVRVRFAPSPTGHLHIGAARTALFNWLFARHNRGEFILRIEDTDLARSSERMSRGIIEGLQWLGLDWDEGPIFQSRRIKIYREKAEELVRRGRAYGCYCLPDEIQRRKEEARSRGEYWEYDRRCFRLSEKEKRHREAEGRPKAIRFFVPEGRTRFSDLIHGEISVENTVIEDFVLLRSDGLPTYHLSVVVDDLEEEISHVIRGDDHISNTPKQILLYRAFERDPPQFAHLPLILGPDKKKLSKRHGVTSVLQFKEDGYLPLALLNFLAQMSWSPGGEEDKIYTAEEMIKKFSLDKVSRGSPVLDPVKLEKMNNKLISRMRAAELAPYVAEELKKTDLWDEKLMEEQRDWFYRLIDLLKERSRVIKDFALRARPYLTDSIIYDREGVEKYLSDERLGKLLQKLREDFQRMSDFRAPEIERVLRERAEKEGVKAALLIHALRMLVVGEPVSPGIFDVLELMGKEKTIQRMGRLQEARNA